jgi:hypothetical protein
MRTPRAAMRPKGKARGSIHTRLQALEARIPERLIASDARQRVGDFLDRLTAWRQAGCPASEEGRELRVIADAFRRRRAELRGRGDSYWLNASL